MPDSSLEHSQTWAEDLNAAKDGDRGAIGKILQQYWTPLWTHASLHIGDDLRSKEAASDIVQDTLLEAQLCIKHFRGSSPSEFQAWLRNILANNIRDVWRRYGATQKRNSGREVLFDFADDVALKGSGTPSLLEQFLLQEELANVRKALEHLPEQYRVVIQLRHWNGMTFDAMGVELAKHPDTVRQQWYRALELLAELLKEDNDRQC